MPGMASVKIYEEMSVPASTDGFWRVTVWRERLGGHTVDITGSRLTVEGVADVGAAIREGYNAIDADNRRHLKVGP